jgi:hypothetical protein
MKKILNLIIFLSVFYTSNAQSEFKISDTLTVSKINKSEVFESWLEFIAVNFKSANNVIQYQNKDRGKIILKGDFKDEFRTDFTLSLVLMDNGWSYAFSNIKSLQYDYDYIKGDSECYTKQCRTNVKKWKESTLGNFNLLIKNILNTMGLPEDKIK